MAMTSGAISSPTGLLRPLESARKAFFHSVRHPCRVFDANRLFGQVAQNAQLIRNFVMGAGTAADLLGGHLAGDAEHRVLHE